MMTREISGFERSLFRHGEIEHAVYDMGHGRGVVIMHELPGMTPSCIDLAKRIAREPYRVFLPLLFGQPNRRSTFLNLAQICIGREFGLLACGGVSPITEWVRALCRKVHGECGGPGVGAIGLCFTGNLAIALMADDSVMAPVTAEPARPLITFTRSAKADVGVSQPDLEAGKARAARGQRLLGLRFTHDRLCPAERFATLKNTFGSAFEAIEIDSAPGNPHGIERAAHSVLTKDLVDREGHPTRQALERVLGFLRERLGEQDRTS
jgi:dienelactone hydrolase